MDHLRILRRSLEITWRYRVLWVFGFILALTTARSGNGGGGGGAGSGGGGSSFTVPLGAAKAWIPPVPNLGPGEVAFMVAVGVLLALVFGVLFTVARYVAETAAIRMVDGYETNGVQVGLREGFRLGWSRAAFRMFLIDLIFALGVVLLVIVLLLVALAPMLALMANNDTLTGLGTAATVMLMILVVLLLILVVAVVTVLVQFFHRSVVLEGLGVFASIRRGWVVVRSRPGDVIIMALILFGLSIASIIVILPVLFILLLLGAAVGGIPGLLAGLVSSLFLEQQASVIVRVIVGVPLFLLVVILPLLFIDGLTKIFASGTWTLTYREMLALEATRG